MCPAFTKMLNEEALGARVVAAYKGGSKDLPNSANRVEQFAEEISHQIRRRDRPRSRQPSAPKWTRCCWKAWMRRVHLEQARQVIAAKKPLFIDKPLAGSLEDAREIARLAKAAGVPWFSTSSLRYGAIANGGEFRRTRRERPSGARGRSCRSSRWSSPGTRFTPSSCCTRSWAADAETVSRTSGPNGDAIVGHWKDGRIGTVYAARPDADYGAIVFRGKEVVDLHPKKSAASEYRPLVLAIVKFFQDGHPPVANEETLEIFAFMDAAQRSKAEGGRPIPLQ